MPYFPALMLLNKPLRLTLSASPPGASGRTPRSRSNARSSCHSTRITSAPIVASMRVALGPATIFVRSITRTPCSGRGRADSGCAIANSPPRVLEASAIAATIRFMKPAYNEKMESIFHDRKFSLIASPNRLESAELQRSIAIGIGISLTINDCRPSRRSRMKYTRIYADAAGESHLEDVTPRMSAADHSSMMSEMIATKGVIFRETNGAQYFVDWHNAPRRQFVVNLSGEVEITV